MEYCIGSASDLVEVHKHPLKESEISAIIREAMSVSFRNLAEKHFKSFPTRLFCMHSHCYDRRLPRFVHGFLIIRFFQSTVQKRKN